MYDIFHSLRNAYNPPLTGAGLTVAVLDSGVNKNHEALKDKIILQQDFTGTGIGDVFGHGTAVSFTITGDNKGIKTGVCTGALIIDFKVLDNDGNGSEEDVISAIEAVCQLVANAQAAGKLLTDDLYPNTINLSLGGPDDGDVNSPLRVACRTAVHDFGIEVIAAAGNAGPAASSIITPACDDAVVAVGAIQTDTFLIMDVSSRGPTLEGLTKPDFVVWGENITVAGPATNTQYRVLSGTSFSAPIMTGLDGLLWELARRVYGEQVRVTWYDWVPVAYAYAIKPENVVLAKDNTYGFGLPAVSSMITKVQTQSSSGTGATDIGSTVNQMMPLLMMGFMMPMMVKTMNKVGG
jgi:serine protease AprX